jgi:conjugal transfer pilus assembly protein TraV
MMKKVLFSIFLAAATTMSGCSVLNPYKSEFTCPQKENGKCVSVDAAYDESLSKGKDLRKNSESVATTNNPEREKSGGTSLGPKGELLYREEVNRKLAGLLREPVTPLVAPSQVVRVLLLPYRGDGGELFMSRFVYFIAEEPRWIMGGYLQEETED